MSIKECLLDACREQAKRAGGKIIVRGEGNKRRVRLFAADGRTSTVWYPVDARVNDCEVSDLRDAFGWVFEKLLLEKEI